MVISYVSRQQIIDELLDRMNNGEKLSEELLQMLTDFSETLS